jgi:hypothetical protein
MGCFGLVALKPCSIQQGPVDGTEELLLNSGFGERAGCLATDERIAATLRSGRAGAGAASLARSSFTRAFVSLGA